MQVTRLFALALIVCATGCASYTTPGGGADLTGITDYDIKEAFRREPAAHFPARIALVRVQATGYSNRYAHTYGYGDGRFSVVTARDVETDADFQKLADMPQVAGLAPLNRLVIPARLESLDDLRQAAAPMRTDVLLVYTLDTSFRVEGKDIAPLRAFSLGVLSSDDTSVDTTASAAIIDVRTGYIYGLAEATAHRQKDTNAWNSDNVVDRFRQETEAEAFGKLVNEVTQLWAQIVMEQTKPAQAAAVE